MPCIFLWKYLNKLLLLLPYLFSFNSPPANIENQMVNQMVNLALEIKLHLLLCSSSETVNGRVKPWGRDARRASQSSRSHSFFFSRVFFRVTLDGVSGIGAARRLGGPR